MTYRELIIELLQYPVNLNDDVTIKDYNHDKRSYAPEYLFEVKPELDFDGKLVLTDR